MIKWNIQKKRKKEEEVEEEEEDDNNNEKDDRMGSLGFEVCSCFITRKRGKFIM